MKLTTYQTNILDFFKEHPSENMYISAKAGCGKSFIAERMLESVQVPSVYIAFNKAIATEMKGRIVNPNVKVYTMHALCNSILNYNLSQITSATSKTTGVGGGIGKPSPSFDNNEGLDQLKIHKILKKFWDTKPDVKNNYEYKAYLIENCVKLYDLVRLKLIELSEKDKAMQEMERIIKEQRLFESEDFPALGLNTAYNVVCMVDTQSIALFEDMHTYDFVDMLYITYLKLRSKEWQVPWWHTYVNVCVDEAQDLSTIQLFLLKFIRRYEGRHVFILDPKQAIYAFSGANSYSCGLIRTLFAPITQFELPINYRCARTHLEYVNFLYNIGIQPHDNAPEGVVEEISKQRCIEMAKPGDFIIGRKNKWLTPIVLLLIEQGKPVYIKDEGLVKALITIIEKNKRNNIQDLQMWLQHKVKQITKRLQRVEPSENNKSEEEVENTLSIEGVIAEKTSEGIEVENNDVMVERDNDQLQNYQTVLMLIKNFKKTHSTNNKSCLVQYVNSILNTTPSPNCITVSSVHRVKGLEANNVFVLNRGKATVDYTMSKEQKQQERNLSYVSLSRAKENLYLVAPDGEEY